MQPRSRSIPVLLVTGSNGQVGFELRRSLAALGHVVLLDRAGCDISRPDEIRRVVRRYQPDVVVNPAAYTGVDQAESDAASAYAVNGTAPGVLGEEAKALGSLLVHYSTDHVFDGRKDAPYVETDAVNPQSTYGKSKQAGEAAVIASDATHVIFRTSWVFATHGNNFIKTILSLAQDRDSLRVVADQFGAPTPAALIADVTAYVVRDFLRRGRAAAAFPGGTYHLAAAGATSWHQYAREVVRLAESLGMPIRAKADAIEPVPTADYPRPAPRPKNSRLDTRHLEQRFGLCMPPWQDGVRHVLEQLSNHKP
jgi:dTDP-4-dehydrorhamnose reductase